MHDFLIIGQGTAGTLLSYFIEKAGASYKIIDNDHQTSSSLVAAGIVNPITGRRHVKSWRVDEFIPFAKQTYQDISKLLDIDILRERNIVKVLKNAGEQNDWLSQTAAEGYKDYLIDPPVIDEFIDKTLSSFGYGEIQKSFQVRLFELLPHFRNRMKENGCYVKDTFDHKQLKIENDYIEYKEIKARYIIFAEGYKVVDNPYFNALPFAPVKGEILLAKIPGRPFQKMLKHQLYVVPMWDDIYWIGSNYDWNFKDNIPTKALRKSMQEDLDQILKIPIEVVDHKAGIRPSFKNRRPIIIHHNTHDRLVLFNGFGSKGSSLIPYWANHLIQHLLEGAQLDIEVGAKKYLHLLK